MLTKLKLVFLGLIIMVSSCKMDEETPLVDKFDREAFLINYADNFIVPGLSNLLEVSDNFMVTAQQFKDSGTASDLKNMRLSWIPLYSSWLKVVSFNFGPAGAEGLRRTMFEEQGGFPAMTELIEEKIGSGDFELDDSFRNTRGLCAIQYILFKEPDVNTALLDFDQSRLDYLYAICESFDLFINTVNDSWKDSFRTEFISNLNTNVTSSTTRMYNGFLMDYFRLSENKIATPMGLVSKQTVVDASYTDVFHSNLSGTFAQEHFTNLKDLFLGVSPSGDTLAPSWKDYLSFSSEGLLLAETIENQFSTIDSAFSFLPAGNSMEELIMQEDPSLNALLDEMRALNHLFESEMSSVLGLAVTFDIDDGD